MLPVKNVRNTLLCLGMGVALACQNKPSFDAEAVKKANSAKEAADRDVWWNNQIQQNPLSEEDVADDAAVQKAAEKIMIDPMAGCGYTAMDNADAVALPVVSLRNLQSKIISGSVVVLGNGSFDLTGKQSQMEAVNVFNVVSTSPNNAENKATRLAQKGSATSRFDVIPQAQVASALNGTSGQVFCGMIMSKGVRSVSADGQTYVQMNFDKAFVNMINPILSAERIKLQLARPIKISSVTATIDTNDEDVIASGLVKKGDVEISLLPSRRNIVDSFGYIMTIKSDVAYRVANKFQNTDGTSSGTPTLLDQVLDYYIIGNKIAFIVVLSPLPELPVVIYQAQP